MRERIAKTEASAKESYKVLHGNGRKGLIEDFAVHKEMLKDMNEIQEKQQTIVEGLVSYIDGQKAVVKSRSKTILQSAAIIGTFLTAASVLVAIIIKPK